MSGFSKVARIWNHDIFGFIHKKKKRLLNRLHGIHRTLSDGSNPFLENLQRQLWWEYEVVLFEEEALWAQKARSRWISQGDRNTKYFHSITMVRRRRNCIYALKDGDGNWVHDSQAVQGIVRSSFMDLYCAEDACVPFPVFCCFPVISQTDWDSIHKPVDNEEIKNTLF